MRLVTTRRRGLSLLAVAGSVAAFATAFLEPGWTFLAVTVAVLLLAAAGMLRARGASSRTSPPPGLARTATLVLAVLLAAVYGASFSAEVILLSLPEPVAALDSLFWAVLGAILLTNRPLRGWILRLP